jgi:predicted nucleotidyltransferase
MPQVTSISPGPAGGRRLFDLGGLLTDLHEYLTCKVDVMTPAMVKPRVREHVLREALPL